MFPQILTKDEIIDDHYRFRFHEPTHKFLYRTLGTVAGASALLAFFV